MPDDLCPVCGAYWDCEHLAFDCTGVWQSPRVASLEEALFVDMLGDGSPRLPDRNLVYSVPKACIVNGDIDHALVEKYLGRLEAEAQKAAYVAFGIPPRPGDRITAEQLEAARAEFVQRFNKPT